MNFFTPLLCHKLDGGWGMEVSSVNQRPRAENL